MTKINCNYRDCEHIQDNVCSKKEVWILDECCNGVADGAHCQSWNENWEEEAKDKFRRGEL